MNLSVKERGPKTIIYYILLPSGVAAGRGKVSAADAVCRVGTATRYMRLSGAPIHT
jgi:hypothetical protein